jgi:hypothetical protein
MDGAPGFFELQGKQNGANHFIGIRILIRLIPLFAHICPAFRDNPA